MIGQEILHYKILEKLGEGGMGVVYKAQDIKLDRSVAIKFLPRQIAANSEERERFKIEAKAAAALNHPNIATIHSIEEVGDEMFIVMEYIDGQELKSLIDNNQLSIDNVLNYASQIASGLQAAHEKDVTHRDIKSANIMVTEKSQVKIMDFGLAKVRGGAQVTKLGTTLGTAAYMSPEQAQGLKTDHRTDIWAFGVVLYEMLTGKMPFPGDYEQAVIYSISNEEPAFPDEIPSNLKSILGKALEKDAAKRYQHVDELLSDLKLTEKGEVSVRVETGSKAPQPRKLIYLYGSIAFAAVAITAVAFWGPFRPDNQTIDSIAVLPLDNLSGDPAQDYFSDGMTEALITDLSKIRALKVISRTSVMQFKNRTRPLPEIARELGVDAVIDGSVMRDGDNVRINVSLIEAATDRNLWADSYERNLTDIFSLQRDIAQTIAAQIKITLTPDEQKQLQYAKEIDPAAYEAYLKGVYHNMKYNPSDFLKSLDFYAVAVEKQPEFALAYVGIVRACMGLMDVGGLPYSELYPKAKAALDKALEINESLAEVYGIQGWFKHIAEWDWEGAEKAFMKSLELNPNVSNSYYSYSNFLVSMDRRDEALAMMNKARSLDPLNALINNDVGYINYVVRRYDEAIREYRHTLTLYPDFVTSHRELGWAYAQKSMFTEAIQSVQRAVKLERSHYNLAVLAQVHAQADNRDETFKILDELLSVPSAERVSAYEIAMIYSSLGDIDEAFRWLEKSYDEHSGWTFFIKTDPMAEPLHSDPRYAPFLRRMGLEP